MSDVHVINHGQSAPRALILTPAVDVVEDGSGWTLCADLPGVSRDKLSVQIESATLTIEGEASLPAAEPQAGKAAESAPIRYRRVFTLARELDAGRVTAELQHGVLTLRIPKIAVVAPQKVSVQVH